MFVFLLITLHYKMALQVVIPSLSFLPSPPQRLTAFKSMHQTCLFRPIRCSATTQTYSTTVSRRSGNYKPSIWDYDFVQSLTSDYKGEMHAISLEKLKEDTRCLLKEVVDPVAQLNLIDTLQRLGVGYLFDMEIEQVLSKISLSKENTEIEKDLYGAALRFRLLRQHGYEVSPDVFNNFKNEMGGFKSSLSMDIKGMLSLYEASHLSFEGETLLDEARAFTSIHLKNIKGNIDPILLKKVEHALDLPLHQRMVWSEIRWYIDIYEREQDMNPILLELAKHSFNTVQTIHQRDLRSLSRWWKDLGLGEKLSFTRDRLVECFLWSVGLTFEPQFGVCREVLTKVIQLVTTIDDVFDVYGSLDELQHFTDAVERWDLEAMEQLPEYIKICFLALHNTVNEIAYDILKEQGVNILPHLKKLWAEMFRAQLVEAKWYHSGYKPTLDEYLKNSWISVSGPVMHAHIYFSLGEKITIEALNCLDNHSNIIPWSSMILRLCDDLGTSTDEIARGDVPKSIQCYMYEADVSEVIARDHVKGTLISNKWKKINEYIVNNSHFPRTFINASVNLARMSHYMYHHGDGHGDPDSGEKSRVMSFLVEPLQVDAAKDTSFYVDKEFA